MGLPAQVNSIIPISLQRRVESSKGDVKYTRLSLDELKRVHVLMARDCSKFEPRLQSPDMEPDSVTALLAAQIFIAQPVSLNWSHWSRRAYLGVVRIALGAANIIKAAHNDNGIEELTEEH